MNHPAFGSLALLLPAVLGGCSGPATAQDVYLALGGTWTIDPDTLCEALSCDFDEVDEVREVIPEVDGVVEVVTVGPTTFTLRALTAGDTLVTVIGLDRGSDVVERYAQAIVRPVNKFNFGVRCDVMNPSEDPWVLLPGGEVFAQYRMYDTDYNALSALPEFEAGEAELLELDVDHDDVTVRMPATPGTVELRSALYEGTVARFEVWGEDAFDGFEASLWPDEPIEIGVGRRVESAMLVQGKRVCVDDTLRVGRITTPATCSFSSESVVTDAEVEGGYLLVYGRAEGECVVELTVPSHGFSAALTQTVVPAAEG